ncbi:putative universal stress protein UspA [hydrothermal vent metagenome]|uniref:Putative universal stress protein UspA n=1 Tax=hydrothermal vent metagenome TaxID=652676 RepID=A0A3B0U444_9ZZZZ
MKRIILPTDFSDNAYNAIDYAVHLFKDVETTFYLLHTYTPAVYRVEYLMHSPSQIGLGDTLQSKAIVELEELQQRLEKEFKNPKHTYVSHSSFNLLVDEVLETIENEKADMVIMGTQGATRAKEIFLGSNTVHVIKKASCPVIAVPSHFKYEKPKEILFPTDYEVDYKREQLQELIEIAKTHISSIEVIHVSTGYDLTEIQLKYKKQLDHIFTEIAHLFHDMPNQEVITAINAFQMKKRMNLLVMIKNKHTFLERLFIDPIIKKIGFHINVPFMVIPSSK